MSEYIIQGETLTSIAEAIRAKTGTTELLTPQEMITAIQNSGGSDDSTEILKTLLQRDSTMKEFIVPEGTHALGLGCFYFCASLESVTIPYSVMNLAAWSFGNCQKLKNVNFNEQDESLYPYPIGLIISNDTFSQCSALTSIKLPSRLSSMGHVVFRGCNALKEVVFTHNDAWKPTLETNSLSECSNLQTVKVPWAEGEVANAPWGATNATIIYNWNPIFEESITFGAYDEDLVGHGALIESDAVLNFENETAYRIFVDGVEYEGYGWKDEWTIGIEVNMGDMMLVIAQDIESGIMNADYLYMESPESTESLPESITLEVAIIKT